ncbi:MAG: hypothetical protein DYG88_01490 [Chloroflexi bacterium CFX4]|nr:hypothetical protein [Chloroflexi bacterium CFX4]MDL1921430.1 hypothetical protein [Chloroflexi bacterium CFX3]
MTQRTTWQSIKTFFSPDTIPFLVSQGAPRRLLPVGTLLIGLILGFLWAYVISPNVYTAAEPVHLGESWKEEYIKQIAWQFSVSQASEVAQRALDGVGNAGDILNGMLVKFANDPELLPRLQAIQPFARNNPEQVAKVTPSLLNSNFTPVLCVIGAAIVIGGLVIFNMIIPFNTLIRRKATTESTVVEGQEAERRRLLEEAKKKQAEIEAAQAAAPQAVASPVAGLTPVSSFMSAYMMGDDFYDDTFSIETLSGEFLGETGAGISKTIGVGDPKKVTALECFVFDKNDIRTVTKVLMSEHAFNDEATRAELAPRGEPVLAKPGATVYLETLTLIIQVQIIDMGYGSGALPPNSFFERLTLKISAYPKTNAAPPPMPPAFGDTQSGGF